MSGDNARPAPQAPDPVVADDLRVRLGGRDILAVDALVVPRGCLVGLVGPNGSGKTTLLRTIAGLQAYDGALQVEGAEVRGLSARALARRVALVRQRPALEVDFTVEEFVLLGRSPWRGWLGAYTPEDRVHVVDALRESGLDRLVHRSLQALSGGELQRVLLAQAFAQAPDVLLLDEPTTHLDVHHQLTFLERVRARVAAGTTVVAVFHDLEQAAHYAARLVVLDGGRVVDQGLPEAVLTPSRLARTFQVDADIDAAPDGRLRISYRASTHAPLLTAR